MAAFKTALMPSANRRAWGLGVPDAVAMVDALRNGDNRA
jgi:hypothetical protein